MTLDSPPHLFTFVDPVKIGSVLLLFVLFVDGEFREKREFICEKVCRGPERCRRRVYTSLPRLRCFAVSLRTFIYWLSDKRRTISALPN